MTIRLQILQLTNSTISSSGNTGDATYNLRGILSPRPVVV